MLGTATGHEQVNIKAFTPCLAARFDKQVIDAWQARPGNRPAYIRLQWYLTPAPQFQTAVFQFVFQYLSTTLGTVAFIGQEHHAHRKPFAQFDSQLLGGHATHERFRHLQQQAATVTGFTISGDAAAMGHVSQGVDSTLQQIMARLTLQMGDKTESAVIAKLAWAVKGVTHGSALMLLMTRLYAHKTYAMHAVHKI